MPLTIVRPLLGTTREKIDAYLKTHHLKFREDATNASLGALRNRIRHLVIPYIGKQLSRNVTSAIRRAATIAADEADWVESLVDSEFTASRELLVGKLRLQPLALQRRTIHRWLQNYGIVDLDFETIERVRSLIDPEATIARVNLPRDRHARRRAGKIFIE